MQIHVVQPGDSVWSIAQRYGADPQRIAELNGLDALPYLVVGQALVIEPQPQVYTVQRGDSLYAIARRFGVTVESIAQANGTKTQTEFSRGCGSISPVQSKQYGYIETNGYIEPSTPQRDAGIVNMGRFLTYVSPFSYQVREDGSLTPIADELHHHRRLSEPGGADDGHNQLQERELRHRPCEHHP